MLQATQLSEKSHLLTEVAGTASVNKRPRNA
jgi:hypothetical protein